MTATHFTKLTTDWNAEPNSPLPKVAIWETDVLLSFYLNHFIYDRFEEGDVGILRFRDCTKYRLGPTNDEGWFRGQCRFTGIAPAWGEFYEVRGDLRLDRCPKDWVDVWTESKQTRHFLFYLRDETFECDALSWHLTVVKR